MRPALVFRSAPDRLGRRVGAQSTRVVERQAGIVGRRWLSRILALIEPPLAREVRWTRSSVLRRRPNVQKRGAGNGQQKRGECPLCAFHSFFLLASWHAPGLYRRGDTT